MHALEKSTTMNRDHSITSPRKKISASDYIQQLKLERHPEGGYFCLNYKSTDRIAPLDSRYKDEASYRFAGSSIYYLLDKEDFSAWHQLKSDEIWHYYDGDSPIDIYMIDHDDQLKTFTLGRPHLTENALYQVVIKAGVWFAAEVRDKQSFALMGCTVSPAFEYDDFILANRKNLVLRYPAYESIINKLTRAEPDSQSYATKRG